MNTHPRPAAADTPVAHAHRDDTTVGDLHATIAALREQNAALHHRNETLLRAATEAATRASRSATVPSATASRRDQRAAELQQVAVGLAVLDLDHRYVFVNQTYAALFGLAPADLRGTSVTETTTGIGADPARTLIASLDRAFDGERVSYETVWFEFTDDQRHFTVIIEPLRANDGRVTTVVAAIYDITGSKRAEIRMAEAEERLRLANEAAEIGTFDLDLKTNHVYYSPELCVILGFPEARIVPLEQAFSRVHCDDLAMVRSHFVRSFDPNGDGRIRVDFRFVRKGGEVRWMTWSGQVKFVDAGEGLVPRRVVGACVDITDRMRAETELRASEARYRGVVEGSLQGIALHQNERIVYANSAMARIFGFDSAEELIGKSTFDDIACEEERPLLRARTEAVYRGARLKPHPGWRGFRKDGSEIWVSAMAHPGEWEGRPAVVSFYLDITERKRNEMKLQEALSMTKVACEAGQLGIWHSDPETQNVSYSKEALALLGIADAGQIGTVLHPDDRAEGALNGVDTLPLPRGDHEIEFRIVRPTGEVRWLLSRGHVRRNVETGKHEGLGVIVDITERKHAEEHQQMLTRELDHRVKNTLARVLVILQRSTEGAANVAELAHALEGRIQALAQAHSQLSRHTWRGANLADLVKGELEPYATTTNTHVEGRTMMLKPEAAQALTLVLHELATNAAKYGALSAQHGQVAVTWRHAPPDAPDADLTIEWLEHGGPPVQPPHRKGFGSSVIGELIPYELGGSVAVDFRPDGLLCRVVIPRRHVETWAAA